MATSQMILQTSAIRAIKDAQFAQAHPTNSAQSAEQSIMAPHVLIINMWEKQFATPPVL